MATAVATAPANGTAAPQRKSLIATMAARYDLEPQKFLNSVKATAFSGKGTEEEFIAFLVVADQYRLNPFTKEIFAFPKRGGGIQNVVSVDGWCNIINSHPQMDGAEFIDATDERGELLAVTCRIYRKDRAHPTECTEYMAECRRGGDTPWATWPRRMLRHKALIQCARYAFGFSGIVDQDEAERGEVVNAVAVGPVHAKAKPSPANALLNAPKPEAERQEIVEADPVYEAEPESAAEEASPPAPMSADEQTLAGFEQLLEVADGSIKAESLRDKAIKEHPHLQQQILDLTARRIANIKSTRGERSNGK